MRHRAFHAMILSPATISLRARQPFRNDFPHRGIVFNDRNHNIQIRRHLITRVKIVPPKISMTTIAPALLTHWPGLLSRRPFFIK
jgi:hypothetical protein